MPYDVFWYDDADMVQVYVKAFKRSQDHLNHQAWLSGAYQCNAVSVAVSNAFRKKNSKPTEYLSKPFDLHPDKKDELSEAEKLYKQFKPVMAAFNARLKRKG